MWSFRNTRNEERRRTIVTLAVGAVGGLAVGVLIAGRSARRAAGRLGGELREGAGRTAARVSPTRLARTPDQEAELAALEDAVLDAFLGNEVLRERGIDVGALSRGTVELSGSVWTEDEADLAVRVANGVDGVQTVVNRLEVEAEARYREETRRRFESGDPALTETRWEGRIIGMGRMRQGAHTEPDRPDDAQPQRERALEKADRDQWQEEELVSERPRMAARPEDARGGRALNFRDDELDHQDPHRRNNAPHTLDEPPEERRTGSRVGEGFEPGTELDLEDPDLPQTPRGDRERGEQRR